MAYRKKSKNHKKRASKQNSSDRKVKRFEKVMNEKLISLINSAVKEIIDQELIIQSDEATQILDDHNNKWLLWLNDYARRNKLKLTQPLINAFERESLKYIKTILEQPENIEQDVKNKEDKV